jgi:hypothetical protein
MTVGSHVLIADTIYINNGTLYSEDGQAEL